MNPSFEFFFMVLTNSQFIFCPFGLFFLIYRRNVLIHSIIHVSMITTPLSVTEIYCMMTYDTFDDLSDSDSYNDEDDGDSHISTSSNNLNSQDDYHDGQVDCDKQDEYKDQDDELLLDQNEVQEDNDNKKLGSTAHFPCDEYKELPVANDNNNITLNNNNEKEETKEMPNNEYKKVSKFTHDNQKHIIVFVFRYEENSNIV